jgi:SAM-dependent methyltransferase
MKPQEARQFLKECYRILKPGGILRIVVPDLEGIAREYLRSLEQARAQGGDDAHAWMTLEVLDQLVRDKSEGEMGPFLRSASPGNREFILSRMGFEAKAIWDRAAAPAQPQRPRRKLGFYFRRAKAVAARTLVGLLFGKEYKTAFREGLFRNQGEVHKWMYDSHSLAKLAGSVGFIRPQVCPADESGIPGFSRFGLDVIDGKIRKPDSMFLECRKPGKD